MNRAALFSAALAAGLLAGCAVGPDYHRSTPLPAQPLPARFADATPANGVLWQLAAPGDIRPRGPWWELFGDPALNRLEILAATNNQDLAAAAAAFAQARDLAAAARSQFYPQITAGGEPNGDMTRQQTSANQPFLGRPAGASYSYDTFTAPVYLGWELDLWGRVRRQSEAARARETAGGDDYEAARLAVAAEVADDYFTVRLLDEQLELLTNTVAAYQRSLELTQNLRRGGDASDLDVAQAATQLHTADAQRPVLWLRRAQTVHALAVLCGQAPVEFALDGTGRLPAAPAVPASVPSVLLEQRPDIAAAERRMAAANADVGVAKSAFFPAVRIDGLAGLESLSAGSWFNASSRFWSLGPSLDLPLFTGGLNRANLAAARAAHDAAVAAYRSTVLNAFREVADQLSAQRWLAEEWSDDEAAVASANTALAIANNRYRAGLVTYLDVVTEQTQSLTLQLAAVQLKGDRLTAAVNLIKALGAGWNRPPP